MRQTANLMLLLLLACAHMTELTEEGTAVRIVSDSERDHGCEFISVVTGYESMGSNEAADAESAMNDARNKVALVGGNGMRIISVNTVTYPDPQPFEPTGSTTVTAEALRCNGRGE